MMNFFRKYATSNKWNIGFVENPLDDILDSKRPIIIHWMKHNEKKSWFADPFILDVDDLHIYVLVEEFFYPINRGRISKLTIERGTYQLKKIDVVLELPTHLSYPAIIRKNEKIYIYPENSASGKLSLYEYDVLTNECSFFKTLCERPLTDAIITDLLGESMIVSTELPNPNKNILGFFQNGEKVKECKFRENVARNAGDWFAYKGKVYRPAQDCSETYGGAVILQKVFKNDAGNLEFENVRRLDSDNPSYNQGFHTFNHYQGISVVDAKGFRHPFANKIFQYVRLILGRKR